jgi:hypothetical protein
MLGRLATTVIPAVTIGVTAIVLLGPGRPRAAIGVRVWGLPVSGAGAVAYRIEGVRRFLSVDDAVPLRDLRLEVRDAQGVAAAWSGETGADGIAEAVARSPRPLRGSLDLRVERAGEVLGEGRIQLEERPPPAIAPATKTKIPGTAKGEVSAAVEVVRGVLIAPFEDAIRVSIPGAAPGGAFVEPSIIGGEVRPGRAVPDVNGRAALFVKPLAHMVELSLNVTAGEGKRGTWEGILPVVPGGVWIEPLRAPEGPAAPESTLSTSREIRVVSPAPKRQVYLSILGDQGRVFGAVIPLAPDGAGFYAGRVRADLPAGARTLQATLAGDPFEQGAGTVAWPLLPPEGTAEIHRVELLLDGLPAAESRERARASAARRAAAILVGAAAIFEVLLLLLRSRASQRALEKHLAGASGIADAEGQPPGEPSREPRGPAPLSSADRERLLASARDHPVLWALALSALVGLGFALVLAFATLR